MSKAAKRNFLQKQVYKTMIEVIPALALRDFQASNQYIASTSNSIVVNLYSNSARIDQSRGI
jgi:hypothetical protein